jgi:hypothetical protein
MFFDEKEPLSLGLDFSDYVPDEVELRPCSIGIILHGAVYFPLKSREGVLFVDKKYLSPFEEIPVLYERWTPGGAPYIVAKRGMLIEGIITPAGIATCELADLLCEIGELTAEVAEDNPLEEEPEQMEL